MALAARHAHVSAGQCEARAGMIELRLPPALITVATFAAAAGDALRELAAVHVLVTVRAALLGKYKEQFPGLGARGLPEVAQAARRREMRAGQWKSRLLMARQRELRRRKSLDAVAAFTAAAIRPPGKLAGMRILMAIAAGSVRDLPFEIEAGVAAFTGQRPMPAAQRKIRQIMIESAGGNFLPILRGVAPAALLAEFTAMRILMAGRAIRKRQIGELHECRHRLLADALARGFFDVAFGAGHLPVAAGELEAGALV